MLATHTDFNLHQKCLFSQSVKNIYTKYINIYFFFIIIFFMWKKCDIVLFLKTTAIIKYLGFFHTKHTHKHKVYCFLFSSCKTIFSSINMDHTQQTSFLKLFQTYFCRKWSSFSYFGRIKIYSLPVFIFYLNISGECWRRMIDIFCCFHFILLKKLAEWWDKMAVTKKIKYSERHQKGPDLHRLPLARNTVICLISWHFEAAYITTIFHYLGQQTKKLFMFFS